MQGMLINFKDHTDTLSERLLNSYDRTHSKISKTETRSTRKAL